MKDRVIEFLNTYGEAKFGDEWWPGACDSWLSDEQLREFADVWPYFVDDGAKIDEINRRLADSENAT
jgi:hypothetical protein